MRSIYFIFVCIALSCNTANTVKVSNDQPIPNIADFALLFGSVCCGTTSIEPFVLYAEQFMLDEKVKIETLEKISGLGKEGEYMLLIYAPDWTENQKQKFFDGLQRIPWVDAESNSFGGVTPKINVPRKKWLTLTSMAQSQVYTLDELN